jgi:hypothetical protein
MSLVSVSSKSLRFRMNGRIDDIAPRERNLILRGKNIRFDMGQESALTNAFLLTQGIAIMSRRPQNNTVTETNVARTLTEIPKSGQ